MPGFCYIWNYGSIYKLFFKPALEHVNLDKKEFLFMSSSENRHKKSTSIEMPIGSVFKKILILK